MLVKQAHSALLRLRASAARWRTYLPQCPDIELNETELAAEVSKDAPSQLRCLFVCLLGAEGGQCGGNNSRTHWGHLFRWIFKAGVDDEWWGTEVNCLLILGAFQGHLPKLACTSVLPCDFQSRNQMRTRRHPVDMTRVTQPGPLVRRGETPGVNRGVIHQHRTPTGLGAAPLRYH